jgi:murein DD-endopeptidase MepM/ murein hydrolase activator NlpD
MSARWIQRSVVIFLVVMTLLTGDCGPADSRSVGASPAVRPAVMNTVAAVHSAPGETPDPDGAGYRLPLAGSPTVVHPFEPPATVYASGHRGVDLSAEAGTVVAAAGPGTVTFAGSVAGRGIVVIAHGGGVSTEYEPVDPVVRAGQALVGGDLIGRVDGTHLGCAPDACLHWGARRDGNYFDPMSLLRPLGAIHLIPWSTPSAVATTGP